MDDDLKTYCCPGHTNPISQAVHLGRLRQFDPACRTCPHRHETASLPAKRVAELQAFYDQPQAVALQDAAVVGQPSRGFSPSTAAALAKAFAVRLLGAGERPEVLVASDGSFLATEYLAAVAEGLAWAGCDVLQLEEVTAPCLAWTLADRKAAGGLLVGTALDGRDLPRLKFWKAGGQPLSSARELHSLCEHADAGVDRPTRHSGRRQRVSAEARYLEAFLPLYHALRPLRFAVATRSRPFLRSLRRLCSQVACEMIPVPRIACQPGLHFSVRVSPDGEGCEVLDEQAQPLAGAAALANWLRADTENPPPDHDALWTVTLLLRRLSESTTPLSRAVGRHAA